MAEMMGPSHRLFGAVSWLAAAPLLHIGGWQYAVGTLIAAATAHGVMSPDVDIYPFWKEVIPGGHRGITHFWLVTTAMLAAVIPAAAFGYGWVVVAVVVAWASHLAGDGVFGRIPIWFRLRKRGRSRWIYVGLGLKTGGSIEKYVAVPAMAVAGIWLLAS